MRRPARCSVRSTLTAQLGSIAAPVEILVGEEDYATPPEMARALEAGIAGAHLQIVAKARHLTPIEIPERIAAMLQTLIARKGSSVADRR